MGSAGPRQRCRFCTRRRPPPAPHARRSPLSSVSFPSAIRTAPRPRPSPPPTIRRSTATCPPPSGPPASRQSPRPSLAPPSAPPSASTPCARRPPPWWTRSGGGWGRPRRARARTRSSPARWCCRGLGRGSPTMRSSVVRHWWGRSVWLGFLIRSAPLCFALLCAAPLCSRSTVQRTPSPPNRPSNPQLLTPAHPNARTRPNHPQPTPNHTPHRTHTHAAQAGARSSSTGLPPRRCSRAPTCSARG